MMISTKGRYGVRFLIDLAAHSAEGKVTLKDVSRRQSISQKYLWQIANSLKTAGLISSVAGPHGGYMLAKPPSAITLGNMLAVLEGDCTLVACVTTPSICRRSNACASREVWKEVDKKLVEAMGAITLSDMVQKQLAMAQDSITEYNI